MAKSRGGVWCMHCRTAIPPGVHIVRFAGGIWRRDHYLAWREERARRREPIGT